MQLRKSLSHYWGKIQTKLFPMLEEELGALTPMLLQVIAILEFVRVETHVHQWVGRYVGRPPENRAALARSFIAKAVLGFSTTRMLLDRLVLDVKLRRICGWEGKLPSESTFSRAFAEFAYEGLPAKVHEALIVETHEDRLVGHVSRDASAIEAREKAQAKTTPAASSPRKRGRPKKGEERPAPEPRRLEQQGSMGLGEMIKNLPTMCNVGTKRNSQGFQESWTGYKIHIDTADGDIPVSVILTSASLHDSQAAIPLALMTSQRIHHLYDLMDAAYDSPEIADYSRRLGHVPLIDRNPRSDKVLQECLEAEARAKRALHLVYPEDHRYNERSSAERVNSNLKDNFGGRTVRVRGHNKVFCHLMFGILALTARQLLRLIA